VFLDSRTFTEVPEEQADLILITEYAKDGTFLLESVFSRGLQTGCTAARAARLRSFST